MSYRLLGLGIVTLHACLLSACQACGPFRAAWYLIEGEPNKRTMYVNVLNEGMEAAKITAITLNASSDDLNTGWSHIGLRGKQTLEGGEFLVLPAAEFERRGEKFKGCKVPVRVAVQCEKFPGRNAWATVEGVMPNYLPTPWTQVGCPDE